MHGAGVEHQNRGGALGHRYAAGRPRAVEEVAKRDQGSGAFGVGAQGHRAAGQGRAGGRGQGGGEDEGAQGHHDLIWLVTLSIESAVEMTLEFIS